MTTLVDRILADIAKRARVRTRYEGQPPFQDEILAAEIKRLRAVIVDAINICSGKADVLADQSDAWDDVEFRLSSALNPEEPKP